MSPRYLGCVAVLVRSFARIHETNLKKQGVLPLTFMDPADYDKLEQNDRVSITGLYTLEPGKPVDVSIKKPDGRVIHIKARHTMTREQIAWFKAGSALNAGQPVDVATGGAADPDDIKLAPGDTKAKPGKDV
jgi:aconitate hydratase